MVEMSLAAQTCVGVSMFPVQIERGEPNFMCLYTHNFKHGEHVHQECFSMIV